MKQLMLIFFIPLFFLCGAAASMAQSINKGHFVVHEYGWEGLHFDFSMGDCHIEHPTDGYDELCIEGLSHHTTATGEPQLPAQNTLIVIPIGAHIDITIANDEVITMPLADLGSRHPLIPAQPSAFKSQRTTPWKVNQQCYDADTFYHAPLVHIEPIGVMRGWQVARLTIAPVEYHPRLSLLRLHTHMEVSITYRNADMPQTLDLVQRYASLRFPSFGMKLPTTDHTQPEHYLIVSRTEFADQLQPFIRWKEQEGYRVETMYFDTSSRNVIKERIQQRYLEATATHPFPTFILLVGNSNKIQQGPTQHTISGLGSHPTDLFYADFSGDYLPEAFIGRWPVADTTQLRAVIEKTLNYEQYRFSNPEYLQHTLLVAGSENRDVAPITTNGQVNYLSSTLPLMADSLVIHPFFNPQSANQKDSILSLWSNGVGLVNYTGHSLTSGWRNPTIALADIDSLPSYGQYALVVNNCCLSNAYNSDCMGTHLITKSHGGAIGVIGATNETLWNEDYYWALGARNELSLTPGFDATTPGAFDSWTTNALSAPYFHSATQSQIMMAGNIAVMQYGSPYSGFYWEVYNLMGDPSLMPYLGVPQPMTATLSAERALTTLSIEGTAGSRATIVQDSSVIGVTTIDDSGHSTLFLTEPITADSLTLTVTAQFRQPIIKRIATAAPSAARIALTHIYTEDLQPLAPHQSRTLHTVVTNLGNTAAANHYWTIHCNTEGAAISIPINAIALPTLQPGQHDTISITITPTNSTIPWGEIVMNDSCNGNILNTYLLRFDIEAPHVELTSSRWNIADGNILYGNTQNELQLTLTNTSSHASDSVTLTLRSLNSQASILSDTLALIPDLEPSTSHTAAFTLHTPDSIRSLSFEATWTYNGIRQQQLLCYFAGQAVETFEHGHLCSFPWDTTHPHPWRLVSDTVFEGTYALQSGTITHRQQSVVRLPLMVATTDSIAFWVRTSTESSYDKATFSIDQTVKGTYSGIKDWKRVSYPITPGPHTLTWCYTKDDATSQGNDCVWIDHITLPLCQWSDSTIGYSQWVGPRAPVAINAIEKNNGATLYPNPAHNHVTIIIPNPTAYQNITILDALGRVVDFFPTKTNGVIQYSTRHLRFGVYSVVIDGTEDHQVLRLIKQ